MKTAPLSLRIVLATLVVTSPGFCATKTWDGSSSGAWGTGANWSGSTAPAAGDDLVFPAGITRVVMSNTLAASTVFNSISFRGSNYSVTGNAIGVTAGVRSEQITNNNRIDVNVALRAPQLFQCTNVNGFLEFTGQLDLGTNTLTVGGTGKIDFTGRIIGSGGVTKIGSGQLAYRGAGDNTYTGTTFARAGTLLLSKDFAINSLAGPLVVGDPTDDILLTDTVVVGSQDTIPGIEVTVNFRGFLEVQRSSFIDALHLDGGNIAIDSSIAILRVNSEFTGTSTVFGSGTITGDVQIASGPYTINIADGPVNPDVVIAGSLTGNNTTIADLTKSGAGELELQTTNNYRGLTVVSQGTLTIGDGRSLGTNSVSVNNGASLKLNDAVVTNRVLTLRGAGLSGTGAFIGSAGASGWSGPITLATDTTINVDSGAGLNASGAISGGGALFKTGLGTLTLSGTNANSYVGATEVRGGVLELNRSGNFALPPTPLVIGDESDGAGVDRVRYLLNNQLSVNTDITIRRTGTLDLNGRNDDLGSIDLVGGTLQTGAGTLTMLRNMTATSVQTGSFPSFDRDEARITGNLSLGANSRTFTVTRNPFIPFGSDLIVSAVISSTPGWTKAGAGFMQISGANTYSGTTTVNDGALLVANDDALGSASPGTTVNHPGRIELPGGISVASEPLTLNTSATEPGAMFSAGVSNFWGGNISFDRATALGVDQGSILNLGGALLGPGGFAKEGGGQLLFTGATSNSFAGLSFVKEGTLFCNKNNLEHSIPGDLVIGDGVGTNVDLVFYSLGQVNNQSRVTIARTGKLLLGTDNIGSLSGEGAVEILNTGELRTGANNDSTTFDGVILGGGGLAKRGTGTFTLNGSNTYAGPTLVEAGTLVVNGNQPDSDVTVRANATLAGNGAVRDLKIASGGSLSPGLSPGRLSAWNTVVSNDAVIRVELRGPAAAVDHDQLRINGTLNLTGSKLALTAVLTNAPPVEGQVFTIIDNNGTDAITGTFDSLANGAVTNVGGFPLRINYNGGTGNDVILTVTNLPARAGAFAISTGNNDGLVSPDECNTIFLVVSNSSSGVLNSVTGTLTSPTPGVIITEATATYGNIPANQRRTNATPFQFSTTAPFACGRSIEFLLTVHASNQPPFNVRYALQSGTLGAPQTFVGNAIGLPGSGAVTSPAVVSGVSGGIAKITVSMVLQHPNLGELLVSLFSPGGSGVVLFTPLGGTQMGDNCASGRATFDDDALLPISSGVSPFVGSFRPLVPLSNLDGRSGALVNGVWQLQIVDILGNAQPGVLSCWSISITPATCAPGGGLCAPCNGPFFGAIITNDPIENVVVSGVGPTTCAFDPCSSPTSTTGAFSDFHIFTNGASAACVTVTIDAPCANPTNELVSSAVLLPPFNTNSCPTPIGLSGLITNSPATYSFRVPANAIFRVNVSGGKSGLGLCSSYSLRADGFDCAVPLGIGNPGAGLVNICWPSFGSAFQLQCATNLTAPIWLAVTNPPVSIGGLLCVTNLQNRPQQFYRLRQ